MGKNILPSYQIASSALLGVVPTLFVNGANTKELFLKFLSGIRLHSFIVSEFDVSEKYCEIYFSIAIPGGSLHFFIFLTFVALRIRTLPKSFRDRQKWVPKKNDRFVP